MSDASIRFALTDGSGWRALRWLGRIASLLAAWPLWYAFFGKSQFDWGAMTFGGPGMLVALVLWGWSGYRLRHPRVCLEIDRSEGVARLQRDEGEPITCALDKLGGWAFTSWKTTSTNKGTRTTTTWYAARCAGFGEQNLYVDLREAPCRDWASKVDAAARGLPTNTKPNTIGDWLAARFDAAIASMSGSFATFILLWLTILAAFVTLRQLVRTDGDALEAPVTLAVFFAVLTIGWRAVRGPEFAAMVAAFSGIAFASKPWLAPVTHEFMGEVHRFSPTSETHLYYVIPGIALCVLAAVMASMIKLRSTTPAPTQSEPAKLEPPRPEPPDPASR